jgi:protein-S-isoprenylcysteine O-methyltransferase Ste14
LVPFLGLLVVNASPWPRWATQAMTMIGILFVGIAAIGRSWSLAYIAGRKASELVAIGPYTLCRNPIYLFNATAAVGYGLISGSLVITGGTVVLFAFYHHFLIREEETFLRGKFGAAYEDYCRRVNRFFPSLRAWHDKSDLTLDTRIFRNRMVDHVWIVAVAGVLVVLCQLHVIYERLTLCNLP